MRGHFGLLGVVCACAATSNEPPTVGRGSFDEPTVQSRGWRRPTEIQTILEASPRAYVVRHTSVGRRPFREVLGRDAPPAPRPVDPFVFVAFDADGDPTLERRLPPPDIRPIFEEAAQAFADGRYEIAQELYVTCIERDPDYFKSYTYLGKVWLFLEEPGAAEVALARALELNPLDYQARLFMGDLRLEQGRIREAKDELTFAYALNPLSSAVRERLEEVLKRMDLRFRSVPFEPRLNVYRMPGSPETVTIEVGEGRESHWEVYGLCIACWTFEPACSDRSPVAADPLRLAMQRECLVQQSASALLRWDSGEAMAAEELRLVEAVQAGYLDAVVMWEVIARNTPEIMFLVPEELRADVRRYIDRFVFVSRGRL